MEEHRDVGICGCRVLNKDRTLQLACRRSVPTPKVAFYRLTGLSRLFPQSPVMARYNMTYADPDKTHEVDAVSGAFLMIRREALEEIGPLDERFFMYGEELDWCLRAKRAGWSVMYYPGAEIIHYKGESTKYNSRKAALEFYRAMYLFHRKHFARECSPDCRDLHRDLLRRPVSLATPGLPRPRQRQRQTRAQALAARTVVREFPSRNRGRRRHIGEVPAG